MNQRLLSHADIDIDGYQLLNASATSPGKWVYFATVKNSNLISDRKINLTALKKIFNFNESEVAAIAGAYKSKAESLALDLIVLQPLPKPIVVAEQYAADVECKMILELESVLNPGLFIDQFENRRLLLQQRSAFRGCLTSALNLFSYTGAFTLLAQAMGFANIISVDASKRYLNWQQQNILLNRGPSNETSQIKLICEDARLYLTKLQKKGQRFNLIVCDPPTFARVGSKAFQLKKELNHLIDACVELLNPEGGIFLLAMNDSSISAQDLAAEVSLAAQDRFQKFKVQPGFSNASFAKNHGMQSVWLKVGALLK